MNKQTVSLIMLLLSASSLFFSCGNFQHKNKASLGFDSIQLNNTVHLFADTAKPACNLDIHLTYIKEAPDSQSKDSLNAFILSTCLGSDYMKMQPEQAVAGYDKKYTEEYRSDLEPLYKQEKEESPETISAWYSYYKQIKGEVLECNKHILVYQIYYNEYTGGAHGSYMTTFLNLNLQTLLPIHLDDLFTGEYKEPLTNLLWQQLMIDNKVSTRQELEDLGYGSTGELEPTENFRLSEKGITFYYNIYEIAPYVMGPTEITLSYDSIQHLLGNNYNLFDIFE